MSLRGAVETLKVLRGKVKDFFVIDKSLSIDGACADAKVTGDELNLKADKTELQGFKSETEKNMAVINNKLLQFEQATDNNSNWISDVEGMVTTLQSNSLKYNGLRNFRERNEIDDLIEHGYYEISYQGCDRLEPDELSEPDGLGFLLVYNANSDDMTPIIQKFISSDGLICRRYRLPLNWSEWEWENPPMSIGVEYRTTERWMGNPVYTRIVDFGELPSNSYKSVWNGVDGSTRTIRAHGFTSGGATLPYKVGESYIDLTCNSGEIVITNSSENNSNSSAMVQIWYIKI